MVRANGGTRVDPPQLLSVSGGIMQAAGAFAAGVVGALIASGSLAAGPEQRGVAPDRALLTAASAVMFNVPASAQAPLPPVVAPPRQEVRRVAADGGKRAADVMRSCRLLEVVALLVVQHRVEAFGLLVARHAQAGERVGQLQQYPGDGA